MTADDIKSAARRNMEIRMNKLRRLMGTAADAKRTAETFRKAGLSAKDLRSGIEQVKSFSWVPGFFPTPTAIISRMIEIAGITPDSKVLEPSAGNGKIADAVRRITNDIECVEIVPALAEVLRRNGHATNNSDFLLWAPDPSFDAVIMNPPFERRQDEAHIRHAYGFLKPGGILVSIACALSGERLREWVEGLGGTVESLPEGAFRASERPTGVRTSLLTIRKET